MIVAKTTCCLCGDIIFLDDKYGFTKEDNGTAVIQCDTCFEDEKMQLEEEQKDNEARTTAEDIALNEYLGR